MRLNIPAVKLDDIHPAALGEEVYVYAPKQRPRIYRADLIRRIRAELPDVPFYVNRDTALSRGPLLERYRRAFIGLRLTAHDGVANTVLEMGMMGRCCVHNGGEPNTYPWSNLDDVVRLIKAERELRGVVREGIREKVLEYVHLSDDWLHTEFWG